MSEFINLSEIAERLKKILDDSGYNAIEFCRECDIPPSSFSQMLNGRTKVNVETINKVILRWGGKFDPLWILLGDNIPPTGANRIVSEEVSSNSSPVVSELISEVVRLREELALVQQAKRIDKITVFYTDRSYEVYRPSAE